MQKKKDLWRAILAQTEGDDNRPAGDIDVSGCDILSLP